jgi:hypothetical protein
MSEKVDRALREIRRSNFTHVNGGHELADEILEPLVDDYEKLKQQIVDAECVIRALERGKKDWFAENIYWDKYKEKEVKE